MSGGYSESAVLLISRAFRLGLTVLILTGCATAPIPPTYTQEELKAICERHGGWWRPDILDGFCEYQSPGFT